jgi:rare lipoprotein A (peptidoglycan hydrolase)
VCGNGSCVRLRLTDWCACPRRVIDLSSDAFRRLAPLSQGLVLVRVTWGGDAPRPPATDR